LRRAASEQLIALPLPCPALPCPALPHRWVRWELHQWVYNNICGKWAVILRRPSRLRDMFSGYHAPRALVWGVLAQVSCGRVAKLHRPWYPERAAVQPPLACSGRQDANTVTRAYPNGSHYIRNKIDTRDINALSKNTVIWQLTGTAQ
jgi:hypothetical protein